MSERHSIVVQGDPNARRVVVETGNKQLEITGGQASISVVAGSTLVSGNASQLQGVQVQFAALTANDVLAYDGSKITNRAQVALTDGGNF